MHIPNWDYRNYLFRLVFLFSPDRKNIRWKYVGILLAIQLILHLSCLKLQWEQGYWWYFERF